MKDQKRLNCSGSFSLIRKIAISLCLGMMAVLFFTNYPVQAKNIIKLTPDTKEKTHQVVRIVVKISIPQKEIQSVEYKKRKIKKTNDSYWKKAEKRIFWADDRDENVTCTYIDVEKNGTYTTRVTTTSGEKYIKSIKIKNILPRSERSSSRAIVKDVSKADKNGNYIITVDYYKTYSKSRKELEGKKIGDILDFNGRKAIITKILDNNKAVSVG